jgi:streptogramin lyase
MGATAALESGSRLGGYRIDSVVRTGPGLSVFRAEQDGLGRSVELFVPSDDADSAEVDQFLATARALARIEHAHLLPIYEVGVSDGHAFAVSAEAPGRSLDEIVNEGRAMAPQRAVVLADQIAGALEALEGAGIASNVTSSDVFVRHDDASDFAYVAPLGPTARESAALEPDVAPAVSVARLLNSMVTGDERTDPSAAPEALRPTLERALAADAAPESPTAFIRDARLAVAQHARRRRKRRVLAVGFVTIAAVVSCGAVLGWQLAGSDDPMPLAQSIAPAARIAATIPLGQGPRSLAIGFDSVWVATGGGTVVQVDPKTEQVVGAPIRFGRADPQANVTLRAGAGALFVLDGTAGTLTRIDPVDRRVTGRLRLGPLLDGATVQEGIVWVTRSTPESVRPARSYLVRIDARRLRPIGEPIRVGPVPLDVEVQGGTAWVTSVGNGTVTRVSAETGATKTVRVGTQPVGSALRGDTLWVPDYLGGAVVPLDIHDLGLPTQLVRLAHPPISAAATTDAVWVTAGQQPGATVLYRIDPRTRAVAGRPISLGTDIGWISTGAGAIWVGSSAKNALLKIVPTTPAPEGSPSPDGSASKRIVDGPLAKGLLASSGFAAPFDLTVPARGWVAYGAAADAVEVGRFTDPNTHVTILIPKQYFAADGSSLDVRSPRQLLELLQANPSIVTGPAVRAKVGGKPATRLSITVPASNSYPTICPAPCAILFGAEGLSLSVERPSPTRLYVLRHRGKTVVVMETTSGGSFGTTSALLRGLRFR